MRKSASTATHTDQFLHLLTNDKASCEKWVTTQQPPVNAFPSDLHPLFNAITNQWHESKALLTRISLKARIDDIGLKPIDKAVLESKWNRCRNSIVSVKPCDYEAIRTLVETEVESKASVTATLAMAQYSKDPTPANRRKAKALVEAAFSEPAKPFELVTLSDVEAKTIEWLWPNRIPLGTPVVIAGQGGTGKSLYTVDLAANVSTGRMFADGTPCQIGEVLMINAEDDIARVMRPRLDAAGADVSKIHSIPLEKCGFNLADARMLDAILESKPAIRLVVIDPVGAFFGSTDSYKESEVRGLLAPLAQIAEQRRVTILLVAHLTKGSKGTAAADRVSGSVAVVNASRCTMLVAKDKSDPTKRAVVPIKSNYGNDSTGLMYSIEPHGASIRLAWSKDPVTATADELLAADATGDGTKKDEAKEWLKSALQGGAKWSDDLERTGKDLGYSRPTLWRAKEELNIMARKTGFGNSGRWLWTLPGGAMNIVTPPPVASEPSDDDCWSN